MDAADAIRLVNVAVRLVVLFLCLMAGSRRPLNRKLMLWLVAPLSWAIHGLAFYWVLFMAPGFLSPAAMDRWSAALGLHVALLILGGVWLFLWPAKGRR